MLFLRVGYSERDNLKKGTMLSFKKDQFLRDISGKHREHLFVNWGKFSPKLMRGEKGLVAQIHFSIGNLLEQWLPNSFLCWETFC